MRKLVSVSDFLAFELLQCVSGIAAARKKRAAPPSFEGYSFSVYTQGVRGALGRQIPSPVANDSTGTFFDHSLQDLS